MLSSTLPTPKSQPNLVNLVNISLSESDTPGLNNPTASAAPVTSPDDAYAPKFVIRRAMRTAAEEEEQQKQTGIASASSAKEQASVRYMPSVVRRLGAGGGADAKAEGSHAQHALSGGTSFVQREQQPRIAFKSAYKSRMPPAASETASSQQQQRPAAHTSVKDGSSRSSLGSTGADARDSPDGSKGPTPPPELVSSHPNEQPDAIGVGAVALAESEQFSLSSGSNDANSP